MLLLREVGERIRNHKRLNITHERLQGGGQAANVRVHAADNELIATGLLEQVLEGAAHERGVAPLGQHGVAVGGCQFVEHAGGLVVLQAVAPEVDEQAAVFGVLARRLRGVVDRNSGGVGGVNEAAQVPNGDVDLGVRVVVALTQVGPFESLDEVYLHVVHEQYSAGGVHGPAHAVAVFTVDVGVGLDFGQCHDSPGSCLWFSVVCAAQAVRCGGCSSEWVSPPSPLALTTQPVSLRLSHNHLRACLGARYI